MLASNTYCVLNDDVFWHQSVTIKYGTSIDVYYYTNLVGRNNMS